MSIIHPPFLAVHSDVFEIDPNPLTVLEEIPHQLIASFFPLFTQVVVWDFFHQQYGPLPHHRPSPGLGASWQMGSHVFCRERSSELPATLEGCRIADGGGWDLGTRLCQGQVGAVGDIPVPGVQLTKVNCHVQGIQHTLSWQFSFKAVFSDRSSTTQVCRFRAVYLYPLAIHICSSYRPGSFYIISMNFHVLAALFHYPVVATVPYNDPPDELQFPTRFWQDHSSQNLSWRFN